jgi:hypothetical protein
MLWFSESFPEPSETHKSGAEKPDGARNRNRCHITVTNGPRKGGKTVRTRPLLTVTKEKDKRHLVR